MHTMINSRLRALLTNLEEAGSQHDAQEQEHSKKTQNLEPVGKGLSIAYRSGEKNL
jgi:hypothetical protein